MRLACKKAPWVCICCVRMYGVCICVLDWARHAHRFWMKKVLHTWRYKSYTNLIPLIRILYKIYLCIVLFSSIGYSFNLNNSQFHQFLVARPTLQQHMETEILQLFSSKKEMPARQTIPKDPGVFLGGINPTIILLWGWDWDYQSYREGFGSLGFVTTEKYTLSSCTTRNEHTRLEDYCTCRYYFGITSRIGQGSMMYFFQK